MRTDRYILIEREPVMVKDLFEWALAFEGQDRRVACDKIGDVKVSTVFLGLDHSFDDGPPLLFETMIFGGPHDQYMDRYSTWEQAEAGHEKAVKLAREAT